MIASLEGTIGLGTTELEAPSIAVSPVTAGASTLWSGRIGLDRREVEALGNTRSAGRSLGASRGGNSKPARRSVSYYVL